GTVVHMHERECSIQRRHQKLVEESPAPGLPAATKDGLTAAAVTGARAIGYSNAGTMEFLVDERRGFYFLEMNARLQVEHPVTEEVTGLDLVVAQLRAAAGEPLPWRQGEIVQRRAAIECRVYAEDPSKGFLPSPGTVQKLELPSGEGIRIESGIETGSTVSVHYDPLLLKLVAHGATRAQAIERMTDALDRSVVEGVQTTIPFLRRVVASIEFREDRASRDVGKQFSYTTIRRMFGHLYGADRIWLARWTGVTVTTIPGAEFATLASIRAPWDDLEHEQRTYIDGLSATDLERIIEY